MFNNSINYAFRHSRIALLTKHGKESEIGPLVRNYLGTELDVFDAYDTDNFGTFTREKKRPQSQLETARLKARKAIELSGYQIGMGSEGSFDSDPYTGMLPWNTEMVVLYDSKQDMEICGVEQRPFKSLQQKIRTLAELERLLADFGFPENNLVLRPNEANDPRLSKDFRDRAEVTAAFESLVRQSTDGCVFVENDHRAHRSASRREAIRYATINLVMKCHSLCPQCHSPGFWVSGSDGQLPCRWCGRPSDSFRNLVYRCSKCLFESKVPRTDAETVDPRHCDFCNP